MKLTIESLLKEINNCSVFSNLFNKASNELKQLLVQLVIESSYYSCNDNGYVKRMTETSVRFQKPYSTGRRTQNYCMFTIQPQLNRIVIDIRTDGRFIESENLHLSNLGNKYNGGFEWHRFIVKKQDEIQDAIKIISKCYDN